MGSQKTKTKSNETATTTPNLNAAAPLVDNYYAGLGNLSGNDLKMPTNPLLQGVNSAGMGLLGQSGADTLAPAISGIQGAMGMLGNVQPAGLTQAQAPTGYTPVMAQASTAQTPGAFTPAQAQMANYGSPVFAQGGDAPTAASADVSSIADGLAGAGVVGGKAIDFYQPYENKYTNDVVNATLADLNVSQGEDRAALARKGALNGGFGGSRFGVAESNLIDAQGRTRATMAAQLRSQALDKAFGYGSSDADRYTQAGVASANNATSAAIAKANMLADAEMANTDAQNDFTKTGYLAGIDLAKTNAGTANDFLSNLFNAGNSMSQFNTGQANDAASQIYSTNADMAQFNAGNQQQTNIANSGAWNDTLGNIYSTNAGLNQFNAGQTNQNAQFNAGLGIDQAQAAGGLASSLGGLLNNAGQLDMSKLGLLSGIGQDQQQMDFFNSPAGQAQLMASLINGDGLMGAQSGQTITSSGTSTSKQNGGLGSALLGGAFQLGSAFLGKK